MKKVVTATEKKMMNAMLHGRVSLARGLFVKLLPYSLKAFQSLLVLPLHHFQFQGIVSFSYRINQSVVSFSQSS